MHQYMYHSRYTNNLQESAVIKAYTFHSQQSTVKQCGVLNQGRSQDLGGGQEFFFEIWKFACCEARGVRGHAPPRNFF